MKMLCRENIQNFLKYLEELGFEAQIRKPELDRAIALYFNSADPRAIGRVRNGLQVIGVLVPRGASGVYDIRRDVLEESEHLPGVPRHG